MEKKEQVYQHIRSDTITKLKEEQFESLGLDTLTVSPGSENEPCQHIQTS